MAELPDDAIEAAERALCNQHHAQSLTDEEWAMIRRELPDGTDQRVNARLAVEAAEPLIAARVRAEAVADERQRLAAELETAKPHIPPSSDPKRRESIIVRSTLNKALRIVATGSVPVATPEPSQRVEPPDWFNMITSAGIAGPVATPTEPATDMGFLSFGVGVEIDAPDGAASPVPAEQPATCEHGSAEAHVFRFPGEYGTPAWCVGPAASSVAAEPPPTFEQLLTDPLEQFDTRSELLPAILYYFGLPDQPAAREALLRSIEEYRNAPPATASTSHMVRRPGRPALWFRETEESLAMLDEVRAEVAAVEAAAEQPEER